MPNGLTEDGTKAAADIYYSHLLFYPYQVYINWTPKEEGNILYNDKKLSPCSTNGIMTISQNIARYQTQGAMLREASMSL